MSDPVLVLPDGFTITVAEEWFKILSDQGYAQRAQIDAGQVKVIDTAGVQLLLALQNRLQSHGGNIEFTAMSEPFKQGFAILGLDQEIMIEV